MKKVYKIWSPDNIHVCDTYDITTALDMIDKDSKKYSLRKEKYTITIVFVS